MKTLLPAHIKNESEAKILLNALYINGESFHPEDDANDISSEIFTKEEGDKLNILMDEIYALKSFDPCEYILSLDPERETPTIPEDNDLLEGDIVAFNYRGETLYGTIVSVLPSTPTVYKISYLYSPEKLYMIKRDDITIPE